MSAYIQKARLYLNQERYTEALDELRQALAQEPNNFEAFALFAICLSETGEHKQASEAARQAIGLEPDHPYGYYVASLVSLERSDTKSAQSFIEKAIGLDPYDPDHFRQLGAIHLVARNWNAALAAAEQGLDLDPEDVGCQNIRSVALNRLGRHEEAGVAIAGTLQQSPENAFSHANMGWELLNQGQAKESLTHFREALRLSPNLEYARVGIVEAMKGQFFLYRIFLNWFLFCQKLSGKYLTGILIGGYVGYQVCLSLMNNNPALKPFLLPLVIAYVTFAIMTWISAPLFNLVLRTSRFGRLVLSDEEKRTSTWVGIALLTALVFFGAFCFSGEFKYVFGSLACALMIPLLSTYYGSSEGWPRAIHGLLILFILSMGIITIVALLGESLTQGPLSFSLNAIGGLVVLPFVYSAIASQFAVNFLIMARPRKGTQAARNVWIAGGILYLLFAVVFAVTSWLIVREVYQNYEKLKAQEMEQLVQPLIDVEFTESVDVAWENPVRVGQLAHEFEQVRAQNRIQNG